MSASETLIDTLKGLRAARLDMMSTRWLFAIENKDDETKALAATTLLQTQHAIRKLENTQLSDIRDKLLENESALRDGIGNLESKRENLGRVKSVLSGITGLLGIVGRIVSLIL